MAMERHESLKLWQKSYDLAKELMIVTEKFPRPQQRDGGLANEIRRAVEGTFDVIGSFDARKAHL